ncbi:FAD-dependent oxidoreductase [Bosea sp. PAMC 26642]|uniref:FAD-dependent oxidoreductase n=1 Tax=Bosea sp. (strain PAMC 26642) TaxID=1792307 RepID=UPI0007701903|nr:FAD-dependent oxidoreductase [Bosea sp. PAMC 26642]AMJ61561.1 hypothetical protein AXW83_15735 [Bosea sp. PAMC 26642]
MDGHSAAPLRSEFDVIVAGGGVSGAIAAIAAARTGARTLVIEKLNCLGGNFTAGIMGTTWTFNDKEKLVVKGIPLELMQRLDAMGATVSRDITKDMFVIYDTEMAKVVLNDMALEAGVTILFHTFVADVIMEGDRLAGLVVQHKSGREEITAKVVVDASGDADVAARSGAPFDLPAKHKLHPATLMAKLGNVDVEALSQFYEAHPEFHGHYTHGQQYPGFHQFRIGGPLREHYERGELPKAYEYLMDWFILFYSTPRPREIILNMTGATGIDGTDVYDLTRAEIECRKRLLEALDCYRRFIPGFRDAYIVTTGLTVGIRETRRIIGEYMMTKDDIVSMRRFPDAIASYGAPIGHHTSDGKDAEFSLLTSGNSYDFPYRALLPQKIDNLLVAGRCISVAAEGIGSTRNMTSCMATGQSAGTAAALAALAGVTPRALDVRAIQRELLRQGAYIEGVHFNALTAEEAIV